MTEDFVIGLKSGELVERVVASCHADVRTQHVDSIYLPSRSEITRLVRDLLELFYLGFFGAADGYQE